MNLYYQTRMGVSQGGITLRTKLYNRLDTSAKQSTIMQFTRCRMPSPLTIINAKRSPEVQKWTQYLYNPHKLTLIVDVDSLHNLYRLTW